MAHLRMSNNKFKPDLRFGSMVHNKQVKALDFKNRNKTSRRRKIEIDAEIKF